VVAICRERLLVSKQTTQKFDMQQFYPKELMMQKFNSIKSKSETDVQLQKTWIIIWTSTGLGKILENINISVQVELGH
jgi:hypothetical protein